MTTAYHEAGHTVGAYLTGLYLPDGDIVIDNDRQASVPVRLHLWLVAEREQKQGWHIDDLVLKRQLCFIAAAGYAAEKILASIANVPFDENRAFLGAHGDVQLVGEEWKKPVFLHFVRAVSDRLQQPAVWKMVKILAEALVARKGPMPADESLGILLETQEESEFALFTADGYEELDLPGLAKEAES